MKLTEFLAPQDIRQGVEISSKKRALELIGQIVADKLNQQSDSSIENERVCPVACFSHLFKREKLGSTGINQGVALPHAKLPENVVMSEKKPIAIFLQLAQPIDYESNDNKEVDLIYAVLFPESSCAEYKSCLPEMAKSLSDKVLLKQLRAAESSDEIWQILQHFDQQDKESEDKQ